MADDDISKFEVKPTMSDMMMETPLELSKWINDPEAKKKYIEIIKDIPLSNLDARDHWLICNFADFSHQLKGMKLTKASSYFLFQLDFLVNASLGKGGFARRMIATNILQQQIAKAPEKRKPFWSKKP